MKQTDFKTRSVSRKLDLHIHLAIIESETILYNPRDSGNYRIPWRWHQPHSLALSSSNTSVVLVAKRRDGFPFNFPFAAFRAPPPGFTLSPLGIVVTVVSCNRLFRKRRVERCKSIISREKFFAVLSIFDNKLVHTETCQLRIALIVNVSE